jgi:hypothetical protein
VVVSRPKLAAQANITNNYCPDVHSECEQGFSGVSPGRLLPARAVALAAELLDHGSPPTAPAAAASSAAQNPLPPATGITGGTSSQESPEGQGGGGLDTLDVACVAAWDAEAFLNLVPKLEAAKASAQGGSPTFLEHPDGGRVLVRPAGYRAWGKLVLVEWVVDFDGIEIGLARSVVGTEKRPNVFVHLGSLVLMQLGHVEAWGQAVRWLSLVGVQVQQALPTRADLCVDAPGADIGELAQLWHDGAYICRAKDDNVFRSNKRVTGVVFGKGVRCRVYEKVVECQDDAAKWSVLVAARYDGQEPQQAVRVEFQLRREQLRELWSVGDVADLFSKLQAIAVELSTDWLRFTEDAVDRKNKHQSRAVTAAIWERVQRLFVTAFAPGAEAPRRQAKRPAVDGLLKQAWGCLKSACAVVGDVPRDAGELFVLLEAKLFPILNAEGEWWRGIEERREMFQALRPVHVEPDIVGDAGRSRVDSWFGGAGGCPALL